MKCGEIIHILEELAPTRYACAWDNVGLLLGRRDKEVRKLYLALDVTDEVLDEVIAGSYDMLVTHHPLLFRPISRINDDDYLGRWMLRLLSRDISCYALHTNFDVAPGCMGDLAAGRLGLRIQGPLEVTASDGGSTEGVGRIGSLAEEITVKELCGRVKEAFDLPYVTLYSAQEDRLAKRIAISPGSGKGMIKLAETAECDVLISGDFGHHDGIDAVASGISVINAGHYGLEHIFTDFLESYLKEKLGDGLTIAQADVLCPEKLR
ncbi:MAG: Nif3-like dinuclear metal center hexameric protein [Lachnospiraceae bacterium]|nr:Nif3-like dinuclear metal center hexameric protein [Lachnospiraceae bacterium]